LISRRILPKVISLLIIFVRKNQTYLQ